MKKKSKHPDWAIEHRKPGTELKLIGDKYYLYEAKSIYDKKQTLNHKYSINDAIMHLQSIKKRKYNTDKELITEPNKLTKKLLEKMKISIT